MRSPLVWEENETLFRRVWKHLLSSLVSKTWRKISASGGLEPLQMVSESDTRQCASEEVVLEGGRHKAVC